MGEGRCDAVAVPQLAGSARPVGSVLYLCGGESDRGPCGKLLFVWVPSGEFAARASGRIEIKCRRCKTLNEAVLDSEA